MKTDEFFKEFKLEDMELASLKAFDFSLSGYIEGIKYVRENIEMLIEYAEQKKSYVEELIEIMLKEQ